MQRTPTQLNGKSGKITPTLAILFKSAEFINDAKNLTKNQDFGPIFQNLHAKQNTKKNPL